MEYKQLQIVKLIRERMASGMYQDRLPTAALLAKELGVNIKTVFKAVHRLIDAGMLSAKPKSGGE